MLLDVFNLKNEKVSTFELSDDILSDDIRYDIIHRYVIWQQAKRRAGSRMTKEIGDIRGSTRKIYRQKGTGRARHGSVRAPQFRGGAVIFGPVVRDHGFNLTKKFKKLAFKNTFSLKVKNDMLLPLDKVEISNIKTSEIIKILKPFNVKRCLIVDDQLDDKLRLSLRNLHKVNFLPTIGLNVLDMLKCDKLIVTSEALKVIEKRLK